MTFFLFFLEFWWIFASFLFFLLCCSFYVLIPSVIVLKCPVKNTFYFISVHDLHNFNFFRDWVVHVCWLIILLWNRCHNGVCFVDELVKMIIADFVLVKRSCWNLHDKRLFCFFWLNLRSRFVFHFLFFRLGENELF